MAAARVPVVILCGGKSLRFAGNGTQAQVPKALAEIGGKPILWHVMRFYIHHGFDSFILCLGHNRSAIREAVINGPHWRISGDVRRDPHADVVTSRGPRHWQMILVDTGELTHTGGRVKHIESHIDSDAFLVTYVDGLSNLNLPALLDFHRTHGRFGTVTSVQPLSPFGILDIDGENRVYRFLEKPRLDLWVNGGFFVFRREVFRYLTPESDLERETLPLLAERGELMGFRHRSFWACMDTYKDALALNSMWETGEAPWRVWVSADEDGS